APETGEVVSFDGSGSSDSDGAVVGWSWDWGDATTAGSGATPTHSYGAAGSYTVTLTVTDDDGGTDQTSQLVTVTDPPNIDPTAAFGYLPVAPETGELVSFDGSGSSDSDGSVVGWSWDWGDATTAGSGSTPTHAYATAGSYTVTLTVTDDQGGTDQTSQLVTVTDPPNVAPTADFSVSCVENNCLFIDLSTDSDGTVVDWSWDLGVRKGTSTEQSPSFTYKNAGTYTVLLAILDNDGAGASTSQELTIVCTTGRRGTRCR
ncbi:MAG: PKD domain-containing protein, partial [Gemmatimonadota bacterium]